MKKTINIILVVLFFIFAVEAAFVSDCQAAFYLLDNKLRVMSRLLEETKKGTDLNQAVAITLRTNGKAIIQIATTLTVGLMIWVFSSLKFQAEMGALLAILLFLNMLGALFLIPAMTCILKPKFLLRVR